jgi:hypothetical protein
MHLPPSQDPPIPTKPQVHSRKHHSSYHGTKHYPYAAWVRSPTIRSTYLEGASTLVYEIVLYYRHNRACRIFRTWEDFSRLIGPQSLNGWMEADGIAPEQNIERLHRFLSDLIQKKKEDCAVEFFLRRRLEDCS